MTATAVRARLFAGPAAHSLLLRTVACAGWARRHRAADHLIHARATPAPGGYDVREWSASSDAGVIARASREGEQFAGPPPSVGWGRLSLAPAGAAARAVPQRWGFRAGDAGFRTGTRSMAARVVMVPYWFLAAGTGLPAAAWALRWYRRGGRGRGTGFPVGPGGPAGPAARSPSCRPRRWSCAPGPAACGAGATPARAG